MRNGFSKLAAELIAPDPEDKDAAESDSRRLRHALLGLGGVTAAGLLGYLAYRNRDAIGSFAQQVTGTAPAKPPGLIDAATSLASSPAGIGAVIGGAGRQIAKALPDRLASSPAIRTILGSGNVNLTDYARLARGQGLDAGSKLQADQAFAGVSAADRLRFADFVEQLKDPSRAPAAGMGSGDNARDLLAIGKQGRGRLDRMQDVGWRNSRGKLRSALAGMETINSFEAAQQQKKQQLQQQIENTPPSKSTALITAAQAKAEQPPLHPVEKLRNSMNTGDMAFRAHPPTDNSPGVTSEDLRRQFTGSLDRFRNSSSVGAGGRVGRTLGGAAIGGALPYAAEYAPKLFGSAEP